MIVKLSALQEILGISKRQIDILAKKGTLTGRVRRGEYEISGEGGAVQSYLRFKTEGDPEKAVTLQEQQIKYLKAQTKKIELSIEKDEGRLIPDTEFVKLMERLIIAARTNLILGENEIHRIRAAKDSSEAKRIYRATVSHILTELSKAEIAVSGDGEDDSSDDEALGTAADAHDKRVGRRKHVVKP